VITVIAVGERDLPPAITGDDETQRRGVINRQAALTFINVIEGVVIAGRDLIRTVRQDGRAETTHGTDDSDEDIGPRGQPSRPPSVSMGSGYRPPQPQHNEPTRPPSVSENSGYRGDAGIPIA
jgi:hypothetical protein